MKNYTILIILLLGLTGCSSVDKVVSTNLDSTRQPSSAYKSWATGVITKSDLAGEKQMCNWAEVDGRDQAVKACQKRGGTTTGSIVEKKACHCSDEECTASVAIICE